MANRLRGCDGDGGPFFRDGYRLFPGLLARKSLPGIREGGRWRGQELQRVSAVAMTVKKYLGNLCCGRSLCTFITIRPNAQQ